MGPKKTGCALAVLAPIVLCGAAAAQATGDGAFESPGRFKEQGGPALYTHICQSCHMKGGTGAIGAGSYPALAGNPKLEAAGYPVLIVLNGRHGMPGFAGVLDDGQIAAVVNYVRSNFGNHFADQVTAADVHAARP